MARCEQCLDRLYEYLDRELSPEEMVEVQRHLDACPPCRDRFTFEANILRVVRDCCRRVQAPADLVERVQRMTAQPRGDR